MEPCNIPDVPACVLQQLLYEDPKRWSFSFNMYAQLTQVQMHMKEHVSSVFTKKKLREAGQKKNPLACRNYS